MFRYNGDCKYCKVKFWEVNTQMRAVCGCSIHHNEANITYHLRYRRAKIKNREKTIVILCVSCTSRISPLEFLYYQYLNFQCLSVLWLNLPTSPVTCVNNRPTA